MHTVSQYIDYDQTNCFSKLVTDYVSKKEILNPFFFRNVSLKGIKNCIENRKNYPTNRMILVDILTKQYQQIQLTEKQQTNLLNLSNSHTFTITTAHQPNLFTGHLYFIYKILHTIKLAHKLSIEMPENNYVPVFYMGSEDADFEELGHVVINNTKYVWQTNQTGAVGRMKIDKALLELIDSISGQILVEPFGAEIIEKLKKYYLLDSTIEQATFGFINDLFADYGLLVLLPDNAILKNEFASIIENELINGFSEKALRKTVSTFPKEYKIQTSGREINLFYLLNGVRERIENQNGIYKIVNTKIEFTKEEILNELKNYPERFSPNVILRPVFQEYILPNIAFIGGGGELAYWLELKGVFELAKVPYPIVILRNSFLLVENKYHTIINKLDFKIYDFFKTEIELLNTFVLKNSQAQINLTEQKNNLQLNYKSILNKVSIIDTTLEKHVQALQKKAFKKLEDLEKKMLKAEKKNYLDTENQIKKIKANLFPQNNLQERVENIIPFYAKYGKRFMDTIYENSNTLEQTFCIINTL